jgi:hydroxyacylglutathione hydrolase
VGNVITIPSFSDNYAYLYQYSEGTAFAVDPGDGSAVSAQLRKNELKLTMILCTHSHYDHTAGNLELKAKTGCEVIGRDRRITGIDRIVADSDIVNAGAEQIHVIATPGHTGEDICYYLPASADNPHGIVFTGDTLFVCGCGRLLGADAATMWGSLNKLAALPADTRVYCGHDYTVEDYEFALTVESDNDTVKQLLQKAKAACAAGKPTVPSTMEQERLTNPFLRADSPRIRAALNMPKSPPHEIFAALRRRKDVF